MKVEKKGNKPSRLLHQVIAARKTVLDAEAGDVHGAEDKRVRTVEFDLRAEKYIRAAVLADVREYPVHLLVGLRHRMAGHAGVAVDRVEAADIVKARDMVHVAW